MVGKLQNGMSKNKGKQRKKQKGSVFRLLLLSAYFRILQCVCEILTKTTEWTKYSTPMLLVATLFFSVMRCCCNHALAFSTHLLFNFDFVLETEKRYKREINVKEKKYP